MNCTSKLVIYYDWLALFKPLCFDITELGHIFKCLRYWFPHFLHISDYLLYPKYLTAIENPYHVFASIKLMYICEQYSTPDYI